MRHRSGLALIIVVGVLGLLAALAMAFTTLAQLERRASRQRLYATKATLLARSGIEDALARIGAGQDSDAASARYAGEDLDGNGGLGAGLETSEQVYRPGVLNLADCPLRHALRPSFFVNDRTGVGAPPALLPVGDRLRGYSGLLAGDRAPLGNTYALKVEDESAKINVNGGFLDAGDRDNSGAGDGIPDHRDPDVRVNPADPKDTGLGWNFQLARILGVLGNQPEVGLPTLGTDVLVNRPAGGYRSVADVQQTVGTTTDLSPYLTVSSWADRSVIHPNAYSRIQWIDDPPYEDPDMGWIDPDPYSVTVTDGGTEIDRKFSRAPLALEEGGRPPVNLNAAPGSVLVALLQELAAGSSGWAWSSVDPLPLARAQSVASALVAARPFATWSRFEAFCDGLVPTLGSDLLMVDLLKANFNPNTRSNKELPDQHLWKRVDKTDLTTWSTEGSLYPTGDYLVSVAARLTGRDGRVLAEATLRTSVRAFSLARQTSQRDFLSGRMPDGTPRSCLSLASASPPPPIPVLRTAGAGASWNPGGGGQGLGAMTHPCAPMAPASRVDGHIALATVELPHTDPPYSGTRLCFLLNFDDGWDADVGGASARVDGPVGPPPWYDDEQDGRLQTSVTEDVWPAAGIEPSTFYPDGVHIQRYRAPGYAAVGNLPPATATSGIPAGTSDIVSNQGVFSYWIKPGALDVYGSRIDVSCIRRTFNPSRTQALVIGGGTQGDLWGISVDSWTLGDRFMSDLSDERQTRLWGTLNLHGGVLPNHSAWGNPIECNSILPGLRWRLVTALFDTDETDRNRDVNMTVRGIHSVTVDDRWYPTPFDTSKTEDILKDDPPDGLAPHLVLGTQQYYGAAANNHVIDEFAVLDFGAAAGDAVMNSDSWALLRYQDGRYYKGKDAAFLSAPMDLSPSPVHLLRAWWTAHLPSESHLERNCLDPYWYGGTRCSPEPRLPDPDLAGRCRVELDLLDGTGTLNTTDGDPALLRHLTQGGAVGRTLPAFRYRVRLGVDLEFPADKPILESPVLDDITFAWQPMTGPRILAWTDGSSGN